ncbi:MAG: hypothetical protein HKN33_17190 [Pyrinomonadaceae bacterium]|nr:hypothetical protein [Pyrinomonadaceae bacterium]
MSKIVVDLNEKEGSQTVAPLESYKPPSNRRRFVKILGIFVGLLVFIVAAAGIAGFFYWRYLQTTPQYSLALLVDASRRNDQALVKELVDTDAVIEDFVPQITDKAVELYGRGLAPEVIKRIASAAAPVMPVVKERARAELPGILRRKTKQFEKVPFFVMAAGADRYLDIVVEGDRAVVSSKRKDIQLELTMKKNGDLWQIVGLKDEMLAKRIAERIGQQIIALVRQRGANAVDRAGRRIGVKNLGDLLKKAEELIK